MLHDGNIPHEGMPGNSSRGEESDHAVVKLRAESADAFHIRPAGSNPIGHETYGEPAIAIEPKGASGEAKVSNGSKRTLFSEAGPGERALVSWHIEAKPSARSPG